MLKFVNGDIFESPTEAWINTVNCVGVCGKGLALQFKKIFPQMYAGYRKICDEKKLWPGTLHLYFLNKKPRIIINFPTKLHWRKPSKYAYIVSGLGQLTKTIAKHNILSLAIPMLGCGYGGLEWKTVRNMIDDWHNKNQSVLEKVEIEVHEGKL